MKPARTWLNSPPNVTLRIYNNLAAWTAKEYVYAVEDVAAQNPLAAAEIGLELAGILLAIEPNPYQEANRYGSTTCNTADYAGHADGRIQAELLAVGPWKRCCIGAGVRDNAVQERAGCHRSLSEIPR